MIRNRISAYVGQAHAVHRNKGIITQPKFCRIRVGAPGAYISFTVSMTLAVRPAKAEYALVWDKTQSEADYPGEILQWTGSRCGWKGYTAHRDKGTL